jgi:hypothetical protein
VQDVETHAEAVLDGVEFPCVNRISIIPLFVFHDAAEKEENDASLRLEIATMDIYEATKTVK